MPALMQLLPSTQMRCSGSVHHAGRLRPWKHSLTVLAQSAPRARLQPAFSMEADQERRTLTALGADCIFQPQPTMRFTAT